MISRLLSTVCAIAAAFALLVLTWPQLFGLQNTWLVAQIVSFRGALVAISVAGAALFFAFAIFRPLRRLSASLAVVLLVFAAANITILAVRGVNQADVSIATAGVDESITVLSWNTRGEEPGVDAIAELALTSGADIVALPETTDELGTEVALAMKAGGRPMWVWTRSPGA